MKPLRSLAVLGLLAGQAFAGLVNANLSGPATVVEGQFYTLALSVQNESSISSLENVRPVLSAVNAGLVPSVSAPAPASLAFLPVSGTAHFTWTFSAQGCGNAQFSVSIAADEGGTPVPTVTSNSHQVSRYCTPTPTPTPSPVVSATPWVEVAPREGSAWIHGNIFHPMQGQPLKLNVLLPEASRLRVDLYDRLGDRVKHFDLEAGPGSVSLEWDGRSDDGLLVASGIYVAHFKARGFQRTLKFAVVK